MDTLPDGEYLTRSKEAPDGRSRRIVVRNNNVTLVTASPLSKAFGMDHTWTVRDWFTANTLTHPKVK